MFKDGAFGEDLVSSESMQDGRGFPRKKKELEPIE